MSEDGPEADGNPPQDPRPPSTPVEALRNLGPKSASLLRAAGYGDLGALRRAGAVAVYRHLRADAPGRVSRVMLYALQGAIMDVHWNALPFGMKEALLEEAAAAGSEKNESTASRP